MFSWTVPLNTCPVAGVSMSIDWGTRVIVHPLGLIGLDIRFLAGELAHFLGVTMQIDVNGIILYVPARRE